MRLFLSPIFMGSTYSSVSSCAIVRACTPALKQIAPRRPTTHISDLRSGYVSSPELERQLAYRFGLKIGGPERLKSLSDVERSDATWTQRQTFARKAPGSINLTWYAPWCDS